MNELTLIPQAFDYNGRAVRVVMQDGEPWFVAKDVCDVLEHTNSRMALERLDSDEKGVSTVYTPGGPQEMAVVNEAGLYVLVMTSRLPEAKAFRRWITHDVLPQIRKTGTYIAPHADERISGLIAVADTMLQAVKLHDRAIIELQQDVTKLAERVDNQITITSAEMNALNRAVRERARELQPDPALRKPLYAEIYRTIHDVFGIASYRDLPRKDYAQAMALVRRYVGSGVTERAS